MLKLLEAYNPSEVRAAGRMVKAIIAAGGKAEDILGYAAFAEKHGANPIVARAKLSFSIPDATQLTKEEILGAIGHITLRDWVRFSKKILKLGVDLNEIQAYISYERKKDWASTNYGKILP